MRHTLWIIGEFGFNIFEGLGLDGIGVYAHRNMRLDLLAGFGQLIPEGVNGWLCLPGRDLL